MKFELGLFERPYVDAAAAARANGTAEHIALAREAARAAIVLLKNDRQTLPLAATLRRVAVIGADAVEARLGGYNLIIMGVTRRPGEVLFFGNVATAILESSERSILFVAS